MGRMLACLAGLFALPGLLPAVAQAQPVGQLRARSRSRFHLTYGRPVRANPAGRS